MLVTDDYYIRSLLVRQDLESWYPWLALLQFPAPGQLAKVEANCSISLHGHLGATVKKQLTAGWSTTSVLWSCHFIYVKSE